MYLNFDPCFKKSALIILIIFFSSSPAFGADVRATVDNTNISLNESVSLKVIVNDGGCDVDTSLIKDFKVTPRGESTNIQIINSKYSKEVSHNFLLFPIRKGHLSIPALPVNQDGKVFYTQAITVNVSDSPSEKSGMADIFITADVSKTDPFVSEQIVYTFQLFQAVKIANARLKEPEFKGFFSIKIGDEKTYRKIINGRNYSVTELQYVLIPDKAGKIRIEPSVLTGDIARAASRSRTNRGFPFDSFFNTRQLEPKQYITKSINLNIRSLPAVPETVKRFSGLVGKFSINSEISNEQVEVGDSTTFSVTIEGEGNLIDLSRLDLTVPDHWKIYEDKPVEELNTGPRGYYGRKTFKYAMVPIKSDDYVIGPVSLVYFDIDQEKYLPISTEQFAVSVKPSGDPNKAIFADDVQTENKKSLLPKKITVKVIGHDILPIKDDLTAMKNQSHMPLFNYLVCVGAPPLLFCFFTFFLLGYQKQINEEKISRKKALKILKDMSVDRLPENELLTSLYQSLCFAIRSKAGGKGLSITSSEVERILKPAGCPEIIIESTAALLEEIESIKYSGKRLDQADRSDLASKSEKVIKELCK